MRPHELAKDLILHTLPGARGPLTYWSCAGCGAAGREPFGTEHFARLAWKRHAAHAAKKAAALEASLASGKPNGHPHECDCDACLDLRG